MKHYILARRELVFAASLIHMLPVPLAAQTEPTQGISRNPPRVHALVGARIVARPGIVIERGTVVIRDGVIEAAGADATVPQDARVWDMKGFTITAGFIDLDLRVKPRDDPPETSSQGLGWNRKVRPERDIAEGLSLDGETVRKHHAAGFTTALVCPDGGILSGDGALVSLRPDGDRRSVIAARVAACAGLDLSRGAGREYPASLMGAIALLRQTLLDATWYREAWSHHLARPQSTERPELNLSLEALDPVVRQRRPIAMRADNVLQLLALRRVAEEFRLDAWYLGSGEEYQWLQELEGSGIRLVIPLAFPPPPAVRHPEDAARVSLRDLEEWARAPENPARLALAGIAFAVTPRGLKSTGDFPAALRKAVDRGLPRDAAIAALTTVPAGFLGLESRLGTVEAGKVASLAVFVEEPLTAEAHVREVWVEGERHPVESRPAPDIRGQWRVELSASGQALDRLEVTIAGERRKPSARLKRGSEEPRRAMLDLDGPEVVLSFPGEALGRSGFVRLGGVVDSPGEIRGAGLLGDGTAVELHAVRTAEREPPKDDERCARRWLGTQKEKLPVPFEARGRTEPALFPDALLVRGGTLWTCGPDGSFVGDLLVESGRIEAVGRGLQAPPGAFVIDASGKHVTPGIIDAHSHTAIAGGVNEGTQAITAEVRIGDVIRADDINLYRQLAGGVTCAHLLHGSANPIGGQSAIIKLRWGEAPEGLKLAGAFPTIKFALGENVKQSNSRGPSSTRYPQTRMGVEQIMHQAFTAARRHLEDRREARDRPIAELSAIPRRDLELEAIGEVLEGKRMVHCHSYRQDEILMMIRLAAEFGFHVGTFQHVLEGYKVAPEIAGHGAGASTFSDWWAYKFEVYDAIPYNGALLHRAGVVTSFNSDSNELARRLNLEAAKAVKYGGVSREDALAFVTLNPARQLRIDDRVGSLTRGKDADFVIWSGDPLSTYSVCLETWIEGKRMFSQDEDRRLEERDAARRRELIQRVLEGSQGEKDQDEGDRKPPGSPITVPAGGRP